MRTVIITGATSGFGKLLVEAFLKNGDRVVATGRNLTRRPEELREFRVKAGERLIERDLDVTLSAEREKFIADLRARVGTVDILINNAGHGLFGALEDVSEEQIRAQMEVNFFGTALLTRGVLPFLRGSRGRVFNFSSVLGFSALPMTGLYSASKFAVEGLSEALYFELAPFGVQVCLIEPGGYRTSFAQNIQWAVKATDETSPYFVRSNSFLKLWQKMSTRKNYQEPKDVALGVLRLSKSKRTPLRVPFGKDAVFSGLMRKIVPHRLYMRVTRRVFNKMIPAGTAQ